MRLTYSVSVSLSFQLLNQLVDPHEIWNECYTIGSLKASYILISSDSQITEVGETLDVISIAEVICNYRSWKGRQIC
jgi:hypothetical protein